DRVAHVAPLSQPGLLQDAVEGPRGQIIARPAGDRDSTPFGRGLELAMTSSAGDLDPAVALNHRQNLAER
ncbi:MAG: hypothetical protein H6R02_2842, partial [Burkholderiaceae bacterium]|nr:hypothetical protein [Burkholderiaceae bacterium]